ncbi:MAG: arylsulfatase [Thermoguttaceae bacterium]
MKHAFLLTVSMLAALGAAGAADSQGTPPNIVYVVSDELGYYELGFMGGKTIQSPNLDRMAAEGMRFTNMLAGSCVCAPTRCCLMTGKHSGHTSVRLNGGGTPLRAGEATIASILKPLGYATGGFGKWGCGGRDSTGVPEKHGFDVFFGYYDQVHAHSYYAPYLLRNSEEVPMAGNQGGESGQTYTQYVIHEAAMMFIREHAEGPFFAYLPYTPPHGNFNIPDSDPAWALYKDKPWPESARRYAAMVTMVDRQVGEVLALLKELGLEEKTLVVFSGDNGGADYFVTPEHPRGVHSANKNPRTGVEYRGKKGTLYEGGLRVPFVVRWPGKVAAGTVSDHLGYFPDMLPTIAEATGAKAPADVDGISILPTLIGQAAAGHAQKEHEYLYWEMTGATAIRQGTWRAVRPKANAAWELYDLSSDPSESQDLSGTNPDKIAELVRLAEGAHEPAVEGTFARTDRHERDRRAKFGKQDDPSVPEQPKAKVGRKKAKR